MPPEPRQRHRVRHVQKLIDEYDRGGVDARLCN
jgi:hypothetical protein